MTDIVERLREYHQGMRSEECELMREAAGEIERLRAAVLAEREACMAAINAYIKQGELPEPAHSERNGMVMAYNLIAARTGKGDEYRADAEADAAFEREWVPLALASKRESDMGHTSGPWTTRRAQLAVDGEYDWCVACEIDGKPHVIIEAFGRVAPEVRPNAEANARLIAAAPDLLAALEAYLRGCRVEFDGVACVCPRCGDARSAIAKARGTELET